MKKKLRVTPAGKSAPSIGSKIAKAVGKAKEDVVSIEDLLLDPENPRIRGVNTKKTTNYADPAIQALVEQRMVDKNGRAVSSYAQKMQHEGFIKRFGIMHVAKVKGGYLLCDGNTRVTVMRRLIQAHNLGKVTLSTDVLDSFLNIPVVVLGDYGDTDTMLAWNAVRANMHVLPPKAWGPLQKAEYIYHLRSVEKLSVREIQAMIGQRGNSVKVQLSAYRLFKTILKDPAYSSRINQSRFALIIEAARNSNVSRYLDWDGCKGNSDRIKVFCELMAPVNGTRGFLVGINALAKIRALGDNPNHWNAALDPKKHKNYLRQLQSLSTGKALNELALQFWGAVKKATPDEIESIDPATIKDIIASSQLMLKVREKLAA